MTMADTVAVMNAGLIEQLGAPADLYEHPRSTFVANFLGQSNLLAGRVHPAGAGQVGIDVRGVQVTAPAARASSTSGEVWVGVRPEKVTLTRPGERAAGGNRLPGGVVLDASFVGVSTQYVVRMPWGQELSAFEQNSGTRAPLSVGETVEVSWAPEHTFVLDASQDAHAGDQSYADVAVGR